MANRDAGGGSSIKRVLGALFFIVVFSVWITYHANFVLGRSLIIAFPGWEVTYKSAWPRLFGGATARDVTIQPVDGGQLGSYHFERVRVEVPFWQYYMSAFSRRRGALLKSVKDIRLVFEDGKGEMALPFVHGMAAMGNVSAAPFEAEGCADDSAWVDSELRDMGLSTQGTELMMAYHRTPTGLIKEQSIHTPGAGSAQFRREMLMHTTAPLFVMLEAGGSSEVVSDEWHVKDEGFVAARNAFCAKKDGIDAAQFVARHMATVKRTLQAAGLAPSVKMESAYARYATTGGSLDLSVRYEPPIGGDLYDSDDLGTWVPRLHGEFDVGSEKLPLALQSTPVRPLPEMEDDESVSSTYALMQREASVPAQPNATAVVEPAVQLAVPAAAPSMPATTTTAAAPAASIATAAPTTLSAAATASQRAAPIPPPVTSADSGKLNLASTARVTDSVASVNAPPPLSASSAAVDAGPSTLDYTQLGAAVGQRVMVFLKNKEPMLAEVVGLDKGVVHIRRRLRSGWVEYAVDRANFDYAERRN